MKHLFLFSFFILFATSCDHSKLSTKPAHTGSPGEILIVAENNLWDAGLDTLIYNTFEFYMPMLPQGEPAFRVLHYTSKQFSMILERHRNIAVIKTDPKRPYGQPIFRVVKDKWAKNQLVIEVEANSLEEINSLFKENSANLIALLNKKENERLQARFSVYSANGLMELVNRKFDINLIIPEGFKIAKDTTNFLWLHREKSQSKGNNMYFVITNLLIYYSPHESDSSFTEKNLLKWRDYYVKNIPATSENSYMKTVYSFEDMNLYPEGEDVEIDGQYGRFIRGLWNMENDFMGGPFVSLSTYDNRKQKNPDHRRTGFCPKIR